MRIFSWRWILALVQITAAVAAFVYRPTSIAQAVTPSAMTPVCGFGARPGLRRFYGCLTQSIFQQWRPPIPYNSRVGLVGPYFVASHSSDCQYKTACFFLGVGALWYWLGTALDRLLGRRSNARRSKPLTMLGLATGCLFAVGVAALATFYTMATDADRPYRQIGLFGLIWAVVLLCHFVWSLVVVLKTPALDSPHYPL